MNAPSSPSTLNPRAELTEIQKGVETLKAAESKTLVLSQTLALFDRLAAIVDGIDAQHANQLFDELLAVQAKVLATLQNKRAARREVLRRNNESQRGFGRGRADTSGVSSLPLGRVAETGPKHVIEPRDFGKTGRRRHA